MRVRTFEDLEIWREARRLAGKIYSVTKNSKFARDFRLSGQTQDAAVSIMSNIAEGFERGGNQEFIQFLYIAKGSCGEVRSQLYVAVDQGYVSQKEADLLLESFKRLSIMISHLVDYLKRSGMKGEKFKIDSNRLDRSDRLRREKVQAIKSRDDPERDLSTD
jgi:four helix bundle protein